MRHIYPYKRWLAAVVAAALLLPMLMTAALAVSYPYETVCMDSVNLRRRPNASSTILARLEAGDPLTVLGKEGKYYRLKTPDGVTGYAIITYVDGLDPSPDASPDPSMKLEAPLAVSTYPYDTTTAGYVKLRKKASDTAAVIRTLPAGAIVTVYSVADNYAKVKHERTTGYVLASYVNLANIPTPTPKPTPTPLPGSERYSPVKKGNRGDAVKALQNALIELKFLDAKSADGKFGAKTESAVMLMQKRNGREQTGIADQELQALLYEGAPKNYKGYRQYVTTLAPIPNPQIRKNSAGEAVKTAQTRLKLLGFYAGNISGVCDKATVAAIKDFETMNSLKSDGVLSEADQIRLYSATALDATVVFTPTPSPTPQVPTDTVEEGTKGADAKLVQKRLIELGYYTGTASGTFDEASVKALIAFQKANALEDDGVCGIKTRAVLFAAHPVYAIPTPAPAATAVPVTTMAVATVTYAPITRENCVTIRSGSQGDSVRRLQLRLQELGYYTSRQDGVYLSDDITAVRTFQKANGLTVDGKAGFNTQTVLYSGAAVSASGAISAGTAATVTTTAILRYGSTGNDVITLQNRLIELGYLATTANGVFDAATKTAVVAFQKANKLTADGAVGAKTQAALNSSTAVGSTVSTAGTLQIGSVSSAVTDLQNRLITLGYLTGKADGKFGTQTNLALIAFQKANNLTANGILNAATATKLNSATVVTAGGSSTGTSTLTAPSIASVSAASVRYANWYTEVRAKVKKYPNVTVYDFTTGISWQLNIFSNGAHADAEPITAADTANMNRAFGGKTTWTAKAVWVVLSDGTVYMASTHNTPHGTSHRKDNNFDGHLCVHVPRTEAEVEAIGPYATSHQKAIDLGWAATQRRAGK